MEKMTKGIVLKPVLQDRRKQFRIDRPIRASEGCDVAYKTKKVLSKKSQLE